MSDRPSPDMRREGVEWAGPGVTQSVEQTVAYNVRSTNRVKRVAKDLKQALADHAIDKSYLTCLDIASQFYGYRDYKTLERSLGSVAGVASLDDELVEAGEVQVRRAFHVSVLATEGFATPVASSVVDAVRPTGRASKAPREKQAMLPPHSETPSVAPVQTITNDGHDQSRHDGLDMGAWTPGSRSYLVEEDGTLTLVSTAKMGRLSRGEETWPQRAGREFRFIDAHYFHAGREVTKLRWCVGLFRRFDDSGKMDDGVAEGMRLVETKQTARKWHLSEAQVGNVMRQLKLID